MRSSRKGSWRTICSRKEKPKMRRPRKLFNASKILSNRYDCYKLSLWHLHDFVIWVQVWVDFYDINNMSLRVVVLGIIMAVTMTSPVILVSQEQYFHIHTAMMSYSLQTIYSTTSGTRPKVTSSNSQSSSIMIYPQSKNYSERSASRKDKSVHSELPSQTSKNSNIN